MASHAQLAPSAAERWISCPASVRLVADSWQDVESYYAAEGTKAHALGELEASRHFGLITERQYAGRHAKWLLSEPALSEEDQLEMQRHIADYVDFLDARSKQFPHTRVLLEQKVKTGIEQCYGTSDAVLVSPQHVEIVDLKYGQGISVSAEDNPQLRLYGVGALEMFGDVLGETNTVYCTIFQPRMNNTSSEVLSADTLRAWRDSLMPIAKEALWAAHPRFGPSETACRWCPAAGDCRARLEYMTAQDFGVLPDLLTADELAELLGRISDIKKWCEDVANTALRKAYSEGVALPGWKVVLSGGIRKITDPVAAVEVFAAEGFNTDEVMTVKIKGIGDLEKMVKATGHSRLEDVLGELVQKTEGKPALAREDDKRPAIEPNSEAQREFVREDFL